MNNIFKKIKSWIKKHIVDILPDDEDIEFSEKFR